MKTKTDEGKENYDLWFILEDRGANLVVYFRRDGV